jgi:UDP-N-acetylglucosamine 2-epimerase (non-hydrolysing)
LKENGGSSVLVGNDIENIRKEYRLALADDFVGNVPELWDGKTAERCLEAILTYSE